MAAKGKGKGDGKDKVGPEASKAFLAANKDKEGDLQLLVQPSRFMRGDTDLSTSFTESFSCLLYTSPSPRD